MTGAGSRRKGQQGEREIFSLLSDSLGFVVKRKVVNRKDDPDGIDIPGWAVEVKRVESAKIKSWWEQTERQAYLIDREPILFYRASRQPWQAVVDLSRLNPSFVKGRFQVCLSYEAAVFLIRESLESKNETQ